jgi:hypothetical protein
MHLDKDISFPWKKDDEVLAEAEKIRNSKLYEDKILFMFGFEIGVLCKALNIGGIHIYFRHAYPDAILVRDDTNQVLNVEFESIDSNFEAHGHEPSKCDLIVCGLKDEKWKNPVMVYEVYTQKIYPPSK